VNDVWFVLRRRRRREALVRVVLLSV